MFGEDDSKMEMPPTNEGLWGSPSELLACLRSVSLFRQTILSSSPPSSFRKKGHVKTRSFWRPSPRSAAKFCRVCSLLLLPLLPFT